jgi:DNA adenine methylase
MKYDNERAIIYLIMRCCAYMGIIIKNNEFYFQGLNANFHKNEYSFLKDTFYNNIHKISNFLNETNGKIYNKDYKLILEKAKKGDFVFLDPPYIEKHNYGFNYNKDENLNEQFLDKLYKEVKKLNKRGVKWLMTQADTKDVKDTFKEFTIKKFSVYRFGKKSYVNELLIMNY